MEKSSIRNIAVALDFDGEADEILRLSVEFGSKFEAAVHLVHVYQPDPARAYDANIYPVLIDGGETVSEHEEILRGEKRHLRRCLGELQRADIEAKAYMRSVDRSIPKSILDFATDAEADLIVIGTNRPGVLDRMIVGSVAKAVLKRSHIPVLLVPPPDRRT